MNNIDQLIKELSPDGVPLRSLNTLCKIQTGKRDANHGNPLGKYHFFTCSRDISFIDNYSFDTEALLVAGNGEVGAVKYFKGKFDAYQRTYVLSNFTDINVFYLHHYISEFLVRHLKSLSNNSTISYIKLEMLGEFKIPLPPIEVQNEIVKILQSFVDLEEELESELSLRRKQFSYYCDLFFSELYLPNCRKAQLGAIGKFIRGKGIMKTDLLDSGKPAIHYGEIHTFYHSFTSSTKSFIDDSYWNKTAKASTGDIVLATTSESVEDVCKPVAWLGSGEVAVSGDATIFKHSLDPLFASYYFQSFLFSQHKKRLANGTKVKRISIEKMSELEILVPSEDVQKAIGQKLQSMETLISDTVTGIPAELIARRIQFGYYRDMLLTFKALESA